MRKVVIITGFVLASMLLTVCFAAKEAEVSKESLSAKMESLFDSIYYLEDQHTDDDAEWVAYKEGAAESIMAFMGEVARLVGGDEASKKRLGELDRQLDELKSKLPLRLPAGPKGKGRFGAYYTRLKYNLEWDKLWKVSEQADVVVRFDDFDHRFVFWRGTSYIPCWATYDGAWLTNEFFERRGGSRSGTSSMCEPMSDKQTRYSHVRIVESHDARVVVHWRYSPVDLDFQQPYKDKLTGWGDCVDEYYTIYPDSIGVRNAKLYTSAPQDWIEYQESIVINQPGTIPEENIEYEAVSFANLKGESKTYKWTEDGGPAFKGAPQEPCIQVVNFKAAHRPFTVVNPDGVRIKPYKGHGPGSHFNWWNHWPVAQEKSDTTVAKSSEKPSHSSLSHIKWKPYEAGEQTRTWAMLHGMTDKPAGELAMVGKSWLNAPKLKLIHGPLLGEPVFSSEGYDRLQRAYVLTCQRSEKPAALQFELVASADSPVVNPAFVIKGWGQQGVSLRIDGKNIKQGKDFRVGHRESLESIDVVIWVRAESKKPIRFTLTPKGG